jgi:hypothetical protein
LSYLAVCGFNRVELLISLDFIGILNGHFASGLNSLDIATEGSLKIRFGDKIVYIDELQLIVL